MVLNDHRGVTIPIVTLSAPVIFFFFFLRKDGQQLGESQFNVPIIVKG